ncbi:MAG: fibronectin type III-like domain-contianing protein, partial [Anaerolineae bacterium]
ASSVQQPIQQLKGFRRVHLRRGESRTVAMPLAVRDLAFYDVDSKSWVVEPGAFEIRVGPSSGDIRLTARLQVVDTPGAENAPTHVKGDT